MKKKQIENMSKLTFMHHLVTKCVKYIVWKLLKEIQKTATKNEKRRQKAKSAKMGKGNIFLNHRIMFSYKIPH